MKSVKHYLQLYIDAPGSMTYSTYADELYVYWSGKTTTFKRVNRFCGDRLTELKQRKLTLLKSTIQNL